MISIPIPTVHYLKKNSSDKWKLNIPPVYKNIIVVPASAEYEYLPTLLNSLYNCDSKYFANTLLMIVVNNTMSATAEVKENNLKTLEYLRDFQCGSELRTVFIDACSTGNEMPDKDGGVGFARKIGMDASLTLFDYSVPGKNILICLDADCDVSPNYITGIADSFNQLGIDAASIYFEHPADSILDNKPAIICYELFLRYYVLGLSVADSYYSFHTVGSSMACTAEAYVKNEGMNKKKAAEDFYFIEKLAKNYNIQNINTVAVYPSPRNSWRVPFGTGQRINRFYANTHNEYLLYCPDSFYVLGAWNRLFFSRPQKTGKEYLYAAEEICKGLKDFLILNNFESSINKIFNNSRTDEQLLVQKRRWFDGFRTLKLIHYLRDNTFPMVNMFDALDIIFERSGFEKIERPISQKIPKLEVQMEYLKILRNIQRTDDHKKKHR